MPRYINGFAVIELGFDSLSIVDLQNISADQSGQAIYLGMEGPANVAPPGEPISIVEFKQWCARLESQGCRIYGEAAPQVARIPHLLTSEVSSGRELATR